MNIIPKQVQLIEVGLRDGIQNEPKLIPTEMKLEIIANLISAGIKHIQVASFVNPRLIPQMADAEELIRRLPLVDGVIYSGLALNEKGIQRARDANLSTIEVSISSSDTHGQRNAGMSLKEAIPMSRKMVSLAKSYGMSVCGSIQCAFGCVYEGMIPFDRILDIAHSFMDAGIDRLSICDTTGMATPPAVTTLLNRLTPLTKNIPVSLHFHDTRGIGLVNVAAALACGIQIFDTSFGGMGGCPFVPGAAGNIPTEDTAYLMESLHIETGIDIKKIVDCTWMVERFLDKQFPAKMARVFKYDSNGFCGCFICG